MTLLPLALLRGALIAILGFGGDPPPTQPESKPGTPAAAPAAPTFEGQDRFDQVRSVEELRELEHEVLDLVEKVRPSVVLLRGVGREGFSMATGVIIDKDGLIATCGHVGREPGRDFIAVLPDGTELEGTTLGQVLEGDVDCGLVRVKTGGRELPAVPLGTTKGLARGDWVVALGYTHGIGEHHRPALARVGRVLRLTPECLYIDAPIDAGDSGGPSFNLRGEVVGLNSRCGRPSWQNISTAIDQLSDRLAELEQEEAPGEALHAEAEGEPEEEADGPAPPSMPEEPDESGPGRPARFGGGDSSAGRRSVERAVPIDPIVAAASGSMVRVLVDGDLVAYGLFVDPSGFVVTKASQLPTSKPITVEVGDDRWQATKVASDFTSDVGLLRLEVAEGGIDPAARLKPVQWAVDARVGPGEVLLSPRSNGDPPALGFAAIEERESDYDDLDRPYLGLQTRRATREELQRAEVGRAVTIRRVVAGTPAEQAGLAVGMILRSVDGQEVDSPEALRRLLQKRQVGDRVRVESVEGDAASSRAIVLASRRDVDPEARRGNTSTPISRRSSGFGQILAHDAVTHPSQMGGPLVDLEGHVVGMNIARYDRTATHALPAARMAKLCERLMAEATAPTKAMPQGKRERVPAKAE